MTWLPGFEQVTFPQSLGFPFRWPEIRGVCWHTTQGWRAEHAFNVYRDATKGACPHVTVGYAEAFDGSTNRVESKRRFQHVPTELASYALQRGSPQFPCRTETNASGVIQIERVGFAADDVTTDELKWLGEEVLAPILAACPTIPPWVYKGPRMNDDEWAAWPGGQCGHRDACCQPDSHSDPGNLDLDVILEFALRKNDDMTPEQFAAMLGPNTRVTAGVVEINLRKEDGSDDGWWPVADVLEFTHRHIKAIDIKT